MLVNSKIAILMTDILRKDVDQYWYNHTEEKLVLIDKRNYFVAKPSVISLLMYDRLFIIDTDSSTYEVVAFLLQKQDLDESNKWAMIGYFSTSLRLV